MVYSQFGVKGNYYPLTTEYIIIFNLSTKLCEDNEIDFMNLKSKFKKELIEINKKYSKKSTEYWYLNCISNSNIFNRKLPDDFENISYYDYCAINNEKAKIINLIN